MASRWKDEHSMFFGMSSKRRNIILAIPAVVFLFWVGNLVRYRDARNVDSIVLDHLREANIKNGDQPLRSALHEADEYYNDLMQNARADYEDNK